MTKQFRRTLAAIPFELSIIRRVYASPLRLDQPSILCFHGLKSDDDGDLPDDGLHLAASRFEQVCAHLSKNWCVLPLADIIGHLRAGETLPQRTVALTFDDGYASNFEIGLPILERYALPATIFPVTSFLDGHDWLWFNRLRYALLKTDMSFLPTLDSGFAHPLQLHTQSGRLASLETCLDQLKTTPQEGILARVKQIENGLGCSLQHAAQKPDKLRPLTWDQARLMRDSGLVSFGGHSHQHLILGRCEDATTSSEIANCAARLTAELGYHSGVFAFPNGKPDDIPTGVDAVLQANGFNAAVTTSTGTVSRLTSLTRLPRQRNPISAADTERVLLAHRANRFSKA
jgi:peptidoglycan/xylan/chitin deacetylase (PgdA/CDA1 family)